jgi:hypothetical protein
MDTKSADRGGWLRRLGSVCGLLAAIAAAPAYAQKGGLAFWEPPPADAALLEHSPHGDAARYDALRKTFVEFHCTDERMQERPANTRGDKNLVCTLPGQTPTPILIVARYDGKADVGWDSSWVDGFLLPVLYHALEAQPRRHTFVFAALHGEDGEASFFAHLHSAGMVQPSAMVILDGMGMGAPVWYTVAPPKPSGDAQNPWGVNGLLGGVASAICRVLKVPDRPPLNQENYTTNGAFFDAQNWRGKRYASTLFKSAGEIPELLIYTDKPDDSNGNRDLATADIHKDVDFAAWFLCFADVKLDPPAAPAPPATTTPAP